jgi:Mg2+/citrate symporter
LNEKDKEFIDNVRKKINYIEYVRSEEERIQQRKKTNMKKSIKLTLVFSIILCIILIPVIITKSFDMIYVFILGMCILGFCCYYENYSKEISE